jgi:UMF1 family MFS transporter
MTEKKKVFSWALYDWANSAYSTTIMAGFFPLFYKQYWSAGADSVVTTTRLGDLTAATSLVVALVTPGLGALADARGSKKKLLLIAAVMGWIGCMALGFLPEGAWVAASLWYAIATIGFNASSTFYDSLLPGLTKTNHTHRASSLGFSLGYLGGGVLFLINVMMYLKPELFGLENGIQGVQFSFLSVALWWAIFSIPLFKYVPEPESERNHAPLLKVILQSFTQVLSTVKEVFKNRNLTLMFFAFWLYIDGVYTIMTMAVDFGLSIGLHAPDLIKALLIVQFVGFPSAYLFGSLAGRAGARVPILICIFGYSVATVLATRMSESWHFYCLAIFIGLFQGGVQALSRSLFSNMIPTNKAGEYFGLVNLVGKFAAILGPFLVARFTQLTGDHRQAQLSLLILFFFGGYLLWQVKETSDAA